MCDRTINAILSVAILILKAIYIKSPKYIVV